MSDLISRQAVLDELEKWDWQDLYLPIHFKQILDDVPSVENKGEWIIYGFPSSEQIKNCTEDYYCSECKFVVSRFESRACNFCPNCGADMRGD